MRATIRPAGPRDAPEIARLVGQYWAFEEIEGYDPGRVESLLRGALAARDRAACWVTERSGSLVAYLLAVIVFSLEHGGLMAEIDELFVIPAARGAGIGHELLRHAEQSLARRGLVRLQLQVGVQNERARAFYAENGYARRSGCEIWDKPLTVV